MPIQPGLSVRTWPSNVTRTRSPKTEPAKSWAFDHPFWEAERLERIRRISTGHPEDIEDARRRLAIVNARRDEVNERINMLRARHQKFLYLTPEWRALTAEREALMTKLGEQT